MTIDPAEWMRGEESLQRSLHRFGWMQPLLTFIGMLGLGAGLYLLSQTPEVDTKFPPSFLLGLASGFLSTAIIFYFYEVAFNRRMERRAYFARQSGTRLRMMELATRKQALIERQSGLLAQVQALSPGGIVAFRPSARPDAEKMLALAVAVAGTLREWNAIEDELAAALRDNARAEAEEGDPELLKAMTDQLLAFGVQRQEREMMHAELVAEITRLRALLPGLPEMAPQS